MKVRTSHSRPKPIRALYAFLDRHKAINRKIQSGYIAEALSPPRVEDRVLLLMHKALNSQPQLKLDLIAPFLEDVAKSGALRRCRDFRQWLVAYTGKEDMRQALESVDGWGPKTAALFVRNLAIIETTPHMRKLLWADVDVLKRGEVELPVDAVTLEIFKQLGPLLKRKLDSYKKINGYLREDLHYSAKEMLTWDDLWFWGFINQRSAPKSKRADRIQGWNDGKYWSIPHAPKDRAGIAKIKRLSNTFRSRLQAIGS